MSGWVRGRGGRRHATRCLSDRGGDAVLTASSWAAPGPGRVEPGALPKFPLLTLLDLTCDGKPGRAGNELKNNER